MNRRMSVVRRQTSEAPLGIQLGSGLGGHHVTHVEPGSAGSDAGLAVGDTITHVNGARIADRSAADAMTLLKQAGAEFSLVVERAGQVQQMSGGLSQAEPSGEGIGITLVTGGAFKSRSAVTSVKPGSLGDRAGLQAGDVIASVNGVSMVTRTHAEVIQALKSVTSDQIEIGVERGNDKVTAKTTSAMALELGVVVELTTEGLVQVIECFVNGAADRQGIRVGDILLAVDGQSLIKRKSFQKTVALLRNANPAAVNLVVASSPRVVDFAQAPARRPQQPSAHSAPSATPPRKHYVVEVSRLTVGGGNLEPLGMGLGTDDHGGHHVTRIVPGGAANRAGLVVGDGVEAINGKRLGGVPHPELMAMVATCGANVTIAVTRDPAQPAPEHHTPRQAPRTVLITDSFSELEI